MAKYRSKLKSVEGHTSRVDLSDDENNRALFQAYIEVSRRFPADPVEDGAACS